MLANLNGWRVEYPFDGEMNEGVGLAHADTHADASAFHGPRYGRGARALLSHARNHLHRAFRVATTSRIRFLINVSISLTFMTSLTLMTSRYIAGVVLSQGKEAAGSAALTHFESSDRSLDAVWELNKYTITAASLDVNTDSNTRQRDTCTWDAFLATVEQGAVIVCVLGSLPCLRSVVDISALLVAASPVMLVIQ
jgi:hypothetical protein